MIDPHAVFYGRERISIAPTARIDAFCLLSAGPEGIEIGEYVHISAGAKIFGGGGKVILEDFANLSIEAVLITATDDFSENGLLIGSCVSDNYRRIKTGPITLGEHSAIGAKSLVFPGVFIGRGATVGAMSLVNRRVPEWAVMLGIPIRQVGIRDRAAIEEAALAFRQDAEEGPARLPTSSTSDIVRRIRAMEGEM